MAVGNDVRPVGVDGTPVLGAHHVGVEVESVGPATSSIAVGVVAGCHVVTGVEGGDHGVLVALIGVVLGAEVVVDKIGIAVIVTTYKDEKATHILM